MFHGKLSQAMHYDNTLSNTQRRDCQGFKQAACYQDTLSNRHRSDCWNFQGSSAACSNVIWGRHRTPRHLAGKLVFKRMLHLCPFTIRTPATLNRSLTWKWKIEFLESKSFPGSGSILGCLKKCEPFWERNAKPRNPYSSILLLPVFFVDPSVYWRHISGARLPRKCLLFQDILRPLVGPPPLAPVTST